MRNRILAATLMLLPICASAQENAQTVPSKAEFSELLTLAAGKVAAFDNILATAKPSLDKQDPTLYKRYATAAGTATEVIQALQETSPSAYGLLGLITTLDDVTLNASRAATVLLLARGSKDEEEVNAAVAGLGEAQNGCYEVSERITNATLRLIKVEEKVLMERMQDPK